MVRKLRRRNKSFTKSLEEVKSRIERKECIGAIINRIVGREVIPEFSLIKSSDIYIDCQNIDEAVIIVSSGL